MVGKATDGKPNWKIGVRDPYKFGFGRNGSHCGKLDVDQMHAEVRIYIAHVVLIFFDVVWIATAAQVSSVRCLGAVREGRLIA